MTGGKNLNCFILIGIKFNGFPHIESGPKFFKIKICLFYVRLSKG